MSHLICEVATELAETLQTVRDVAPGFMPDRDKADALVTLSAVIAQATELKLRVLAESDELAAAEGAASPAIWAGVHLQQTSKQARADLKLARALTHLPKLRAAFSEGRLSEAHATAVRLALEQLPPSVGPDVLHQAEVALVDLCRDWDPVQVRRFGRAILATVDPEGADQTEQQQLLELEKNAAENTRLTMKCLGDGTTRISARLPDHAAARLTTFLHAWSNPRKAEDVELLRGHDVVRPWLSKVPYPRRAGEAFISLLEAMDPERMPIHGGAATTLVITIDWEKLCAGVGAATLAADVPGEPLSSLSAGEVRRLACRCGIVPMVLGGESEVLDVGRRSRFFTSAQRTAMVVRDKTCLAEGCDIPAAWCEAHHFHPWASGGRTDLNDGGPLCSKHHHWEHDPTYASARLPSGRIRFTRLR